MAPGLAPAASFLGVTDMAVASDVAIEPDPVLDRAPAEEDRDHLACCRDFMSEGPIVAICGYVVETDRRVFSDHLCRECIEAARARLRSFGHSYSDGEADPGNVPSICVRDGSSCPEGAEEEAIERKILGL